MNVRELVRALQAGGVPSDAYAVDGSAPDEAYVLLQDQHCWLVFYSERGTRGCLRQHLAEGSACEDLWNRLRPDRPPQGS